MNDNKFILRVVQSIVVGIVLLGVMVTYLSVVSARMENDKFVILAEAAMAQRGN